MSVTATTVAWLLAAMTAWSPPGRTHQIAEAKETLSEAEARYEQIADAIVTVEFSKSTTPIFQGANGRARTAMLVLSVAFFESGFRKDVDLGIGKQASGDSGKSHCMMQVNLGKDRTSTTLLSKMIGKDWSANDLLGDRTKCFFAGHQILSRSFQACRALPLEHRLAVYASGTCTAGHTESYLRVHNATRWYSSHKPPFPDTEVVADLEKPSSEKADDIRLGMR